MGGGGFKDSFFLFVNILKEKKTTVFIPVQITERESVFVCLCVCVCVRSPGRFNPALISHFYQSIPCFVHHVSILSTINGNVPCDTVHLIKVVCLTLLGNLLFDCF